MFTTFSAVDLGLDLGIEDAADLAQHAGFSAVDLPMRKLLALDGDADQTGAAVAEALLKRGLRAGGWWLPTEFREDAAAFQRDMVVLPEAARIAQLAGAKWCNTWLLPFSDERKFGDNFELHAERLSTVALTLGPFDCVLGIEFVGPKTMRDGHRFEFIHDLDGARGLVAAINQPNTGVLLDSWQWYTSHGTTAELDTLVASDITYVHLNDAPAGLAIDEQIDEQRMLPGATGVIDIVAFVDALRRVDFDGPIAVEPYNEDLNKLPAAERVEAAFQSLSKVLHSETL